MVLYNSTYVYPHLGVDKNSELPTIIFTANEIKNKNRTTRKEPSHSNTKIYKERDNHNNFETERNINSKESTEESDKSEEDSDGEGECGKDAIIHYDIYF